MQKSLQALPGRGFTALTRTMGIFSVAAAVIVALYAVIMIVLGTLSSMSGPLSWSAGVKTDGAHITISPPVEKRLDMNCPELKKKTGADMSKCAWLPYTSSVAEIASREKAQNTFENWFKAAISPVFWSLPVFLLVMGLVEAARCLNGLAGGRYFHATTVTHLRNFAIAGLLYVILTPCMPALANGFSHLVTWFDILIIRIWPPNEPYSSSVPTHFEANANILGIKVFCGFLILLYAFTLAVIATVMARASAIVDDHAEII